MTLEAATWRKRAWVPSRAGPSWPDGALEICVLLVKSVLWENSNYVIPGCVSGIRKCDPVSACPSFKNGSCRTVTFWCLSGCFPGNLVPSGRDLPPTKASSGYWAVMSGWRLNLGIKLLCLEGGAPLGLALPSPSSLDP